MIDILFALLNTAVLFLVLAYLYRRFMYERIQQAMLLEHATHLNLVKRQESLRKQEQGLVRAYYHQHYRYEELSKKIDLWRQQLEVKDQQQRLYQEDAALALQRMRQARERYLHDHQRCASIMGAILTKAQHDLQEYFENPEHRDAYMQSVIASHPVRRGSDGTR